MSINTGYRPVILAESKDEELVVEDDAELLLERIEEEMAAEEPDSDEDEDVFLHVDDLNKVEDLYFNKAHSKFSTNGLHNVCWLLTAELYPKNGKYFIDQYFEWRVATRNWKSVTFSQTNNPNWY